MIHVCNCPICSKTSPKKYRLFITLTNGENESYYTVGIPRTIEEILTYLAYPKDWCTDWRLVEV